MKKLVILVATLLCVLLCACGEMIFYPCYDVLTTMNIFFLVMGVDDHKHFLVRFFSRAAFCFVDPSEKDAYQSIGRVGNLLGGYILYFLEKQFRAFLIGYVVQ